MNDKPSTPEPTAGATARIDLATATADITNAFGNWHDLLPVKYQSGVRECKEAHDRVFAYLAQREAEQRQLHDALAACNVLVAALRCKSLDPAKVVEAGRLARIALAHPGP